MVLNWLIIPDKDSEYWSAQCVELDIATQSKSLEGLVKEIKHQIEGHTAYARRFNKKLFEGLMSPPSIFQERFKHTKFWISTRIDDDAVERQKETP